MKHRRPALYMISALCAFAALPAWPAHAKSDAMIEGAKLCTQYLPRYERRYGIPTHLLSAIASTESGRYHSGLKLSLPWPWTINAESKSYYFDTKAEAVAAAYKLRARGVKSFDVGCMQVNMYHHPNAFASLEQAFDPEYNVAYAASFLRALYQEGGSWKSASAHYHSKTPSRGKEYAGTVYDRWYGIIERLRQARLNVPSPAELAAAEAAPAPTAVASVGKVQQVSGRPMKVAALPEQKHMKLAAYQPVRMNSIQLSKKQDTRENGIIVVRPDIKVVDTQAVQPVVKAEVEPASMTIAQQETLEPVAPKIVRLDKTRVVQASASSAPQRTMPNFIFSD